MTSLFDFKTSTSAVAGAALIALIATSAQAANGLTESIYHNILVVGGQATQTDLNDEEAYVAGATPAYAFTNTATTFMYNYDSGYSVADFLGSDGAGVPAVANDTNAGQPGVNETAIVATGTINVGSPGLYTFSIPTADDAAAVFVGGSLVAEQNYQNGLALTTAPTGAVDIMGPESFTLFYYQLGGNADLSFYVSGPGAVAFSTAAASVPEPAAWALMLVGFGGLGVAARSTRQSLAAFAA